MNIISFYKALNITLLLIFLSCKGINNSDREIKLLSENWNTESFKLEEVNNTLKSIQEYLTLVKNEKLDLANEKKFHNSKVSIMFDSIRYSILDQSNAIAKLNVEFNEYNNKWNEYSIELEELKSGLHAGKLEGDVKSHIDELETYKNTISYKTSFWLSDLNQIKASTIYSVKLIELKKTIFNLEEINSEELKKYFIKIRKKLRKECIEIESNSKDTLDNIWISFLKAENQIIFSNNTDDLNEFIVLQNNYSSLLSRPLLINGFNIPICHKSSEIAGKASCNRKTKGDPIIYFDTESRFFWNPYSFIFFKEHEFAHHCLGHVKCPIFIPNTPENELKADSLAALNIHNYGDGKYDMIISSASGIFLTWDIPDINYPSPALRSKELIKFYNTLQKNK